MCLVTYRKEPQIATEPITVYKVFGRGEDGSYISPIRGYNFGILNIGDTIKPEEKDTPLVYDEDIDLFIVSGGYIYAFTEKNDCITYQNCAYYHLLLDRARNVLPWFKASFIKDGGLVMAECVIPVGASYYIDASRGEEICASELIIKGFYKREEL